MIRWFDNEWAAYSWGLSAHWTFKRLTIKAERWRQTRVPSCISRYSACQLGMKNRHFARFHKPDTYVGEFATQGLIIISPRSFSSAFVSAKMSRLLSPLFITTFHQHLWVLALSISSLAYAYFSKYALTFLAQYTYMYVNFFQIVFLSNRISLFVRRTDWCRKVWRHAFFHHWARLVHDKMVDHFHGANSKVRIRSST